MDTLAICGFESFYNQRGIKECRVILDNIKNNSVPESKQQKVLLSLFLKDPFNSDVYKLYLEKYGDADYELSLIARLFGMEFVVREAKRDLLIKKIQENNGIVNKAFIVSILDANIDKEADITYPEMLQNDCERLQEIYRNLFISEDKGLRHLKFVAKNVATNATRELSSDILEEFLINRFGYAEDITDVNFKEVKLMELSKLYHFSFDSIADGCFSAVNIEKLSFEGIKINTLCRGAFRGATINSIDVLDIANIPDEAFEGCRYLKKVDFLRGTITIGNKAFWGCDSLELVVIPNTVTTLPAELTDNTKVVFENYDRETYSYKYCMENNLSCKISRGAELYEYGCNFQRNNVTEAYKYFFGAAEERYAKAYFELGNCYYNGSGTAVNYVEALRYYELAADETENPLSYHMLGYMYLEGQGTISQPFKAVRRFVRAAELGVTWSMNMMGTIYLNGRGGMVNISEAAKWFKKGADLGDAVARENYQEIIRNNPGIVIASDKGKQDYDIRKIAQNMLPAFADEMFKEFGKEEGDGIYYYGTTEKSSKKFGNAIAAYAPLVKSEVPLVCYDATYFGNAKDGCVLTNYGIYVHNDAEDRMHIIYKFIKDLSYNNEYVFINYNSDVIADQKIKIEVKIGKPLKVEHLIRYIQFYMQ